MTTKAISFDFGNKSQATRPWWYWPKGRCWLQVERRAMKNERYVLRELTRWHQALCSPPVYLDIEDRDHITLGRVTHSERGWSLRHCVVTGVIWDDRGPYTVRWLWHFLLLHARCSIFWHGVTGGPRRAAVSSPVSYSSELLLAASLKGWVWFCVPSFPLVSVVGQEVPLTSPSLLSTLFYT